MNSPAKFQLYLPSARVTTCIIAGISKPPDRRPFWSEKGNKLLNLSVMIADSVI